MDLVVEVRGQVGWITFNRSSKGNSITSEMSVLLLETMERMECDPEVRLIVLTGNGKYFCTGMDLSSVDRDKMGTEESAQAALDLFNSVYYCSKPVISRLNGPALGGGIGFMFGTDIRLAKTDFYLQFSEVRRGIIPAVISSVIVPQIGSFLAKDLMLTGRRLGGERCYELGLLTGLYDSDESLDTAVETYINSLLSGGPSALKQIKQTVRYLTTHTEEENETHVKQAYKNMFNEEAQHGILSFMTKQKPNWDQFLQPKL
eukprot:TRINITY_DN1835_c0_g1_i1.p1 TRINITY_DN1835_c0_g1~~TRINITY_DN1835_c0_g1_i1.p1  ORF type:complete len:260 (-),score=59.31 TRINITY_DN1835_c0_g1_i1:17-796(-)